MIKLYFMHTCNLLTYIYAMIVCIYTIHKLSSAVALYSGIRSCSLAITIVTAARDAVTMVTSATKFVYYTHYCLLK